MPRLLMNRQLVIHGETLVERVCERERERERDSVCVRYVRDLGNDNRFFVSMCVEDRERHVHGALCCVTWRHIYIIRE